MESLEYIHTCIEIDIGRCIDKYTHTHTHEDTTSLPKGIYPKNVRLIFKKQLMEFKAVAE